MLKELLEEDIDRKLKKLLKELLDDQHYPKKLKKAEIIMISKQGKASNYRIITDA